MNRPMRWAVVIVGLAAELAFLVGLDGLGAPRWAVWLCVVPAVFVAEAYLLPLVRRPRVPDRPARDPGRAVTPRSGPRSILR